jgi:hypothetical protein
MPDSDFLEGYGMPLAVGEAYGRVRIPLAGLPDGVAAYTVPVTDAEGAARVPVDRKKRLHPKEADLITERPVRRMGLQRGSTRANCAGFWKQGLTASGRQSRSGSEIAPGIFAQI